jgi:hypothetical protein
MNDCGLTLMIGQTPLPSATHEQVAAELKEANTNLAQLDHIFGSILAHLDVDPAKVECQLQVRDLVALDNRNVRFDSELNQVIAFEQLLAKARELKTGGIRVTWLGAPVADINGAAYKTITYIGLRASCRLHRIEISDLTEGVSEHYQTTGAYALEQLIERIEPQRLAA